MACALVLLLSSELSSKLAQRSSSKNTWRSKRCNSLDTHLFRAKDVEGALKEASFRERGLWRESGRVCVARRGGRTKRGRVCRGRCQKRRAGHLPLCRWKAALLSRARCVPSVRRPHPPPYPHLQTLCHTPCQSTLITCKR